MRKLIGILLMAGGVALMAYISLWVMLIPGVTALIDQARAPAVDQAQIVAGVIKMVFAFFAAMVAGPIIIIGRILVRD